MTTKSTFTVRAEKEDAKIELVLSSSKVACIVRDGLIAQGWKATAQQVKTLD